MKNTFIGFPSLLLKWYQKNKRDLPWRKTSDPYKIWISEIMLQQTTVNTVIPYYERWVKKFPTVDDLSKASLPIVLKEWQGLGYYQRARNTYKSAQIIVEKFNSRVPSSMESLKQLPGFGPYTCGAVLSIAFQQPKTIIDANVRRVFMRLLSFEGVADTKHDALINKTLLNIIPNKRPGDFNQAIMELGALICRSINPICNTCPVSFFCSAYRKGIQEIIPETKKKVLTEIVAVIAIIQNKGNFLIQQRSERGLLAGLWEFPGGKLEKQESDVVGLKREIKEEMGVDIISMKHFCNCTHYYTQYRIHLKSYLCQFEGSVPLKLNQRWVSKKDFKKYPMPSGSAKILTQILKKL